MIKLKKILSIAAVLFVGCLMTGCSSNSSITYTYKDTMTLPAEMIGGENYVDISGIEKMTLYYSKENVTKINDSIEYSFENEVTDKDKETVKKLLLDSFDSDEKGISVKDNSTEDKISVNIQIDLKNVDKKSDIITMFNLSSSEFNDDNTYPLKTLENALITAGYEK